MLLHVAVDRGSSQATVTPPGGWSLESEADSSGARSLVYSRFAGVSEPSTYDVSFSANLQASAGIVAYSDVDRAAPIVEKSPSRTSTSATSLTLDSVQATKGGRLAAFFAFSKAGVVEPSSMTQIWDVASEGLQISTSAAFDQQIAISGATGTRSAMSPASGEWAGQMFALRAAPRFIARYGFGEPGDVAQFTMDSAQVVERRIPLPGGAMLAKRTTAEIWSYPNTHGDVSATADESGTKSGPTSDYSPYGVSLDAIADNADGRYDYGWLGEHSRGLESEGDLATIEMGARPYVPNLGRFLGVDPVESGSANDYVYVSGDPVNSLDTDGTDERRIQFTCTAGTSGGSHVHIRSSGGGIGFKAYMRCYPYNPGYMLLEIWIQWQHVDGGPWRKIPGTEEDLHQGEGSYIWIGGYSKPCIPGKVRYRAVIRAYVRRRADGYAAYDYTYGPATVIYGSRDGSCSAA
jgi:RHS repeat-associated protein